jgi:hypothetical protein
MVQSDKRTLIEFVDLCREALAGLAGNTGSMFNGFPIAACGPSAELLGRAIEEQFGLEGVYVCGVGHPSLPEMQTHAWVETDDAIIDVTYDQFENTGLQGWVFSRDSVWHAQFFDIDRRKGFCMPSGWPVYPHDGYGAMRHAWEKEVSRAHKLAIEIERGSTE